MKALTFGQFIAILQQAERIKKRVIALEQKQKPFTELKGLSIRMEICVN